MKKSVCLMAILGAFAATSVCAAPQVPPQKFNQTVNVKFTGDVVKSSCQIDVLNGTNKTVKLGALNLSAQGMDQENAHGDLVPLIFKISGCAGDNTINGIKLIADIGTGAADKDPGVDVSKSDVSKGTLLTNKPNVLVQIYKQAAGGQEGLNEITNQTLTNGQTGLYTVGYVGLKRMKDEPKAGTVKAEGMFEVTFN